MGGRVAWPFLACAALPCAAPALARTGPATPAEPPAPSARPPAQPVSLIVAARWLDVRVIGQPACPRDSPDGEQCLSLNVIADVRLDKVRTLAGPDLPRLLTARFEFHALPARGYYQVLLVRPSLADRGRFDAISLGRMRRNRQLCVGRSWLSGHDVPLPRRAHVAGDRVCFRPYFAGGR